MWFSTTTHGAFAVRRVACVPGFQPWQMRHTFACQWLEKGRSIEALRHALGYSSVATTEHYAGLSDDAIMRELSRTLFAGVTRTSPSGEIEEAAESR